MRKIILALAACGFAGPSLILTGAAHAATWACTSSAQYGECFTGDNPFVENNVWGLPNSAFVSQTLNANSASDWEADADIATGNKSVVSYPSSVTMENDKLVSSFANLNSTWNIGLPGYNSSLDDEAAYDIWLGGNYSSSTSQEIMVWVDTQNQTPAGAPTVVGTILNHGIIYKAYSANGGKLVSLVAETNSETGEVGIKDILEWVEGKVPYDGDDTLNQVDFGFEICSTGAVPKGYFVNDYTLDSNS